jgi:hypothetical protein
VVRPRDYYGEIDGVTPTFAALSALDESASPSLAPTLPAPGSSGVTVEPLAVASYRPVGAGYGALTELVVVAEYVVAARVAAGAVEFIEVGPISVVLKGVSVLLPAGGATSYAAPGFSGPGGAAGPL